MLEHSTANYYKTAMQYFSIINRYDKIYKESVVYDEFINDNKSKTVLLKYEIPCSAVSTLNDRLWSAGYRRYSIHGGINPDITSVLIELDRKTLADIYKVHNIVIESAASKCKTFENDTVKLWSKAGFHKMHPQRINEGIAFEWEDSKK